MMRMSCIMGRLCALFILLQFCCNSSLKAEENLQKDSIMLIADTISNVRDRIDYLFKVGSVNLNDEWRIELIDIALKEAEASNDSSRQIKALFERGRHYLYRKDVSKQYKNFEDLRIKSYKFSDYVSYFKIWNSLLQQSVVNGDIEYALIQAQKMEDEAQRLSYDKGRMLALQTQAAIYSHKKERKRSLEIYDQVIQSGIMTDNEVIRILHRMSRSLINTKEFDKALMNIERSDSVVNKIKLERPDAAERFRNLYLEQELAFARLYLSMENPQKAKIYLDRSKQYLSRKNFHTQVLLYHIALGRYYAMVGNYDEAEAEFDTAYGVLPEENYSYRLYLLSFIGNNYKEQGRMDEAVAVAKRAAEMSDSINTVTLERFEEVIQSNYQIQRGLLAAQKNKASIYFVVTLLASFVLVVIVIFTVRSFLIKLQLRKINLATQDALYMLEKDNKAKEQFLKTITFEVRIPLNTVVGFVDLLSSGEELTDEEVESYSKLVNQSASGLMDLINQVLDISRLEAGMMKFNKQELDMVQLCNEAVMMTKMNNAGKGLEVQEDIRVESFELFTDQQWFLRVINSLLTPSQDDDVETKLQLKLYSAGSALYIKVYNSPLYLAPRSQQYLRMQNMLNKLAIEQLGYSYEVVKGPNGKVVEIVCKAE